MVHRIYKSNKFFCRNASTVTCFNFNVSFSSRWHHNVQKSQYSLKTSLHIDVNDTMTASRFSLMVSSSSISFKKNWNMFKSTILNSCCVVVSLSSIVVSYRRHWLLSPVQFFFFFFFFFFFSDRQPFWSDLQSG